MQDFSAASAAPGAFQEPAHAPGWKLIWGPKEGRCPDGTTMPVVTWRGTARAPENRIHLSFVLPDGMVLRLLLDAKTARDVAETLLERIAYDQMPIGI